MDAKAAAAKLRSERIASDSDLDLSASKHAFDHSRQQTPVAQSQGLDWGSLKHAVARVADGNQGIRERLWEQQVSKDLGDLKTQAAEQMDVVKANINADQGYKAEKMAAALEAKARFDELHGAAFKMPAARAPAKHAVAFLGTPPGPAVQAGAGGNLAWLEQVTEAVEPQLHTPAGPVALPKEPAYERIEDKREDEVEARVAKEASLHPDEEPKVLAAVAGRSPEAEADDVAVRQAVPPPQAAAEKVEPPVAPAHYSSAVDHAAPALALVGGFVLASFGFA